MDEKQQKAAANLDDFLKDPDVQKEAQDKASYYTPQPVIDEPSRPSSSSSDTQDGAPEIATETVVQTSEIPAEEVERLTTDIVAAIKTVYDPEIPADIYELGLIYKIELEDNRDIDIEMTLTSPGCPVAGEMPGWVQNAVESVQGVGQVTVNLVFDPPWHQGRMSDEAKLALNMF
ncbi:MAG: SUF system Fe-S cluster assembly protein [Hyphomicrobiaceae bacterium]